MSEIPQKESLKPCAFLLKTQPGGKSSTDRARRDLPRSSDLLSCADLTAPREFHNLCRVFRSRSKRPASLRLAPWVGSRTPERAKACSWSSAYGDNQGLGSMTTAVWGSKCPAHKRMHSV